TDAVARPGAARSWHHPCPARQRQGGDESAAQRVGPSFSCRPTGTLRDRPRRFGGLCRCADRRPRGGCRDPAAAAATTSRGRRTWLQVVAFGACRLAPTDADGFG